VPQAVLRVALYSSDARERASASHVIHAFCEANLEGQNFLVASIRPLAGLAMDGSLANGTFGTEVVRALLAGAAPSTQAQGQGRWHGGGMSSRPFLRIMWGTSCDAGYDLSPNAAKSHAGSVAIELSPVYDFLNVYVL
jgi:hypothetical protein